MWRKWKMKIEYKSPHRLEQEAQDKYFGKIVLALATSCAMIYGGWKYEMNRDAEIRAAKGIETKIEAVQKVDDNNANNRGHNKYNCRSVK